MPPLVVAAFVLAWLVAPAGARDTVLVVEIEVAKALALVGCAAAAMVFDGDDYLFRAWALLGACVVCLFARDVFALAAHAGPHDTAAFFVEGAMATVGNTCSVLGTWMLARAWRVAGLADASDRGGTLLLVLAIGAALLVAGWPMVIDLQALSRGDVFALVPLASDLADGAVVVMLAPLARTAFALRGGMLRFPWVFLTASGVLWLLFDLSYRALGVLGLDPAQSHLVLESLRALPTLFMVSAGLSQRAAIVG